MLKYLIRQINVKYITWFLSEHSIKQLIREWILDRPVCINHEPVILIIPKKKVIFCDENVNWII